MVTPTRGDADTPDDYFRSMWATGDDPWAHTTRPYEARKYALTAASLPPGRARRLFEPGCGTGALTALLAGRADAVVAMEREPRGVDVTRRRELPNVDVRQGAVPDDWPEGTFDVIVLSELLYYLAPERVSEVLTRCAASVEPGGHVLAVHYRPEVPEHVLTGDEVRVLTDRRLEWAPVLRTTDPAFVLDLYRLPG